jgi:hypothetical protein
MSLYHLAVIFPLLYFLVDSSGCRIAFETPCCVFFEMLLTNEYLTKPTHQYHVHMFYISMKVSYIH